MKLIVILFGGFLLFSHATVAQRIVEERIPVKATKYLDIDIAFADEIKFKTWSNAEVYIKASVNINDGEDNDLFELKKRTTDSRIDIEMDRSKWEDLAKNRRKKCWESEITVEVFIPKSIQISANTISGDYLLDFYNQNTDLKTISGDIDISIPVESSFDFKIKTISGEVYTDLDFTYPDGKDGLRQIVGMNVKGRLNKGGNFYDIETISGDIYLRRK